MGGAAGSNGTNGANGANGANGTPGLNGTNGINGTAGTSGVAGISGTNGINGLVGTNGLAAGAGIDGSVPGGTSPFPGSNGSAGLAGSAGINGGPLSPAGSVSVVTTNGTLVSGIPVVYCDSPTSCFSTGVGGMPAGTMMVPGTASVADRGGAVPAATLVGPLYGQGDFANVAVLTPNGTVAYGVPVTHCDALGTCHVMAMPTRAATFSPFVGTLPASVTTTVTTRSASVPASSATSRQTASRTTSRNVRAKNCDAMGNCLPRSSAAKKVATKSGTTRTAQVAARSMPASTATVTTIQTTTTPQVAMAPMAVAPAGRTLNECDHTGTCYRFRSSTSEGISASN